MMGFGQCSHCGSIYHDSEDCDVRVAQREAGRRNESLRAEVARLTAELASCQGLLDNSKAELEERTEERDAALTLAEPLDRLYEWAKRTIRADLHSPLEIMGEYESLREERDRMAAALVTLHELMVEITKDEIECAQSDDGFAVKGWIKVIRLKYQAVDALLENPSAILAAVKARAKAEGLREAAEMLDCTINSSAEPVVYAGLISGNAVSDAKLIGLWRQIKERAAQDGGEANG